MFYRRSLDGKNRPNVGSFAAMDLGSLSQLIGSFTLDDNSLALIALLAGMAGGWMLNNWRDQQLRTKKLKIDRK